MKSWRKILLAVLILISVILISIAVFLFVQDGQKKEISKKNTYEEKTEFEQKKQETNIEKEEKEEEKEIVIPQVPVIQRVTPTSNPKITILSYHSIAPKGKKVENTPYQVSYKNFETQLEALKQLGYTFIDDRHLYSYYYKGGKLPKKPVLITFDDGRKDMYQTAFPILKKHKAKASVYIICAYNDVNENYLTKDMIKEMIDSNIISVQIHSYDMHKHIIGADGKKGAAYVTMQKDETKQQYQERIIEDVRKAKEYIQQFGRTPVSMSYPFGKANQELINALKINGIYLGYLGFNQRPSNKFTNPYNLKRYNVDDSINTKQKLIDFLKKEPPAPKPKAKQPAKQAPKQNVKQPVKQAPKQNVKQPVKQVPKQNVKQPVKQVPKQNVKQPVKQEPKQNVKQPVKQAPEQNVKQ